MDKKYQDRLDRALNQKIYIINNKKINDNHRLFYVAGSTGNTYEINIKERLECSCPDHKQRKCVCKHLLYIIVKATDLDMVIDNINIPLDVLNFILSAMDNKFKFENVKEVIKREEDTCAICLNDLIGDLIYCRFSCGKPVHKDCFDVWKKHKKESKCVYCLADIY